MLLLEKILLEAELLDLKANPEKEASGTVIEASLDKGRGYVATVLGAKWHIKDMEIFWYQASIMVALKPCLTSVTNA